jgi:hypothetical protein
MNRTGRPPITTIVDQWDLPTYLVIVDLPHTRHITTPSAVALGGSLVPSKHHN